MIEGFTGQYRFLSNFWHSPIKYEGLSYPTVEHAYQAAKCLLPIERAAIAMSPRPSQAKALGRRVVIRKDWQEAKLRVMEELLRLKFQDSELARALLATEKEQLVEGNYWHDNFWGACVCPGCGYAEKHNHLGRLLMQVREELQKA